MTKNKDSRSVLKKSTIRKGGWNPPPTGPRPINPPSQPPVLNERERRLEAERDACKHIMGECLLPILAILADEGTCKYLSSQIIEQMNNVVELAHDYIAEFMIKKSKK